MKTSEPNINTALNSFLAKLSKHYAIKESILFGSYARGDYREYSDVDVMILLSGKPRNFMSIKLDFAGIAYDVFLETGVLIQALPVWEEQWVHPETFSNPYLLRNIREQGIAV